MSKQVKEILDFLGETDIQIVSYGLAPNPNGFCYEIYGDSCSDEASCLEEMLEGLTKEQEEELKREVF